MDENHCKEKILFVITSCLYLVITAFWVSIYAQPKSITTDNETKWVATAAKQDTIEPADPHEPTGELEAQDDQKVDWISVRGKAAEEIFHPIIEEVADQYDVEPELIKAIIWAESSFNPNAVSKKGAVGLMQLMPSTARAMGVEDFSDPESNINAGVRYFKQLMIQFEGNAELALAAYNAGSSKVREYRGIPPFKTTRFYVKKVFEYYNGFKSDAEQDIGQI